MYMKILVCFLLLFCSGTTAAAERVRLHGSTTVIQRLMEPGREALKQATGVELTLVGNGTVKGVEDLLAGQCDGALIAEELADAVASLKDAARREAAADLPAHLLATEIIRVIINPANSVTRLSREQLKGLYNGTLTNWMEVGGADQAVVVIAPHPRSAARKAFLKAVMDGTRFLSGALEFETVRTEVENVAMVPEAIGAAGQESVMHPDNRHKVKIVDTVEISHPFMVVTRGEASVALRKVISFFTGPGKRYLGGNAPPPRQTATGS